MTTRCLIVDDEPLAIRVIRAHLDQVPGMEVVATCATALEAFERLRTRPVDLLFLDIQMPRLTGLDFLRALDQPPRVIIVTAYREYAVEGFELDVVDYLLKPVSLPRLLRAIDKYYRLRAAEAGTVPDEAPPAAVDPYLPVRVDRRVVKLALRDVRYVESVGDYVKIHTTGRPVLTKQRLGRLEETLTPRGFLRIHRSYLVAVAAVTAFSADAVQIGPVTLPISRTYRRAARERLSG